MKSLGHEKSLPNEIWKPSISEPRVLVSNMGRVLMQPSVAPMSNGGFRFYRTAPVVGSVTRASREASHRYRGIVVRGRPWKVHFLVCEAFHGPRPFPGAVVIHLDEDATNNSVENLKWGTQKENLNMPKVKAYHRSRVGEKSAKKIWQRRELNCNGVAE